MGYFKMLAALALRTAWVLQSPIAKKFPVKHAACDANVEYILLSFLILKLLISFAVLLLAALMAVPKFYEVDARAGLLLLPYIGWTCFASTLINCSLQKGSKEVRNP